MARVTVLAARGQLDEGRRISAPPSKGDHRHRCDRGVIDLRSTFDRASLTGSSIAHTHHLA
eukprot:3740737-Prymnesium_polylepis.1